MRITHRYTDGSGYGTVMVVYEGDSPETWELIECDDDTEDDGTANDNEEDFFTDYDEDYGYEDIYGDSFDEDFDEFYTNEFVFEDDDSEFEYEDFNDFAEEEYASLEVYVFAGETYYILIADATLPSPNQQAENESFRTEYELPPAGGLLVLRSDFIADAGYDVTTDATEGGSVQVDSVGPYPDPHRYC